MATANNILVIGKDDFFSNILPRPDSSGVRFLSKECLDNLCTNQHYFFMPREQAETLSGVVQIIPYVVIRNMNGDFLTYDRTKQSGETRLINCSSIGFGGHIELEDQKNSETLLYIVRRAAQREMKEELKVSYYINGGEEVFLDPDTEIWNNTTFTPKYLLFSEENEVSSVHVGLVIPIIIPTPLDALDVHYELLEPCNINPRFKSRSDLQILPNLELWSKLLIS